MNLDQFLKKRLAEKGYLFVPYLALGDPDFEASFKLISTLVESGADTIELGLPFTDPTADGPVLQKTFERVLEKPFDFAMVFALLERVKAKYPDRPFLLMGYGNLFLQAGFQHLFKKFSQLNIGGIITPDIPFEEKQRLIKQFKLKPFLKELSWVDFVTPTINSDRLKKICKSAQGFIYVVSYKGITGQSNFDLKPIKKIFAKIRRLTSTPLLVGFGIREAAHVKQAVHYADGFIIGSRIHQIIEEYEKNPQEIESRLKQELLTLQP